MDFSNFEKVAAAGTSPGSERMLTGLVAAAANIKGDEYIKAIGSMTLDTHTPMREDAVMWVASCTKLLTTVCALQCVERGQFSLDSEDDVARLVPETQGPACRQKLDGKNADGKYQTKPAAKRATLRQLLTHTNGFAYDFWGPTLEWRMQTGEMPGRALKGNYVSLPECIWVVHE